MLPEFELMQSSQRFVDVRFARICHERGVGMVCAPRHEGWLRDTQPTESIFENYTRISHKEQIDEVLAFGGFGKLSPSLAASVERL
jgi:hypothetical protein